MTLIPPFANIPRHHTGAETDYAGRPVLFRAACDVCGKPNVVWITSPSPLVGARPFYDIKCKHPEEKTA